MKRKISNYFLPSEKSSCDVILARMTALDGLSFNLFVTSQDLRQLLISRGYNNLPTSVTTIRNRIMNYSLQIRERLIKEICQYKAKGMRFSLTFDEWTSTANKRYMNINVHCIEKFWSLGLIRIHGSMSAERCKDILEQCLHKHSISLTKDIVAIVTDGPNIMLKVGRIVEAEHHLCLAHGIHLAVCDVLYNKNKELQLNTIISETLTNEIVASQIEDDCYSSDDDVDEDFTNPQMGLDFESIYKDIELSSQNEININELVKKIRKTVVLFKKSSTKNDSILQKYVKAEKGKELSLLLDCKTRWNSLLIMLERFLSLKTCIQKALIDLKSPIIFKEDDFNIIADIIDVLTPVKLTVEALCRRDANLCTADAVLKLLMSEISKKQSYLAQNMFQALKTRISQRRKEELSGVLQYLHKLAFNDEEEFQLFPLPSQIIIRKQLKKIIERLNADENYCKNTYSNAENESEPKIIEKEPLTLKEKFQQQIEKSMQVIKPETQKLNDLMSTLRKEMALFESVGKRGHHLDLAYQYLMSIPPTSVESERAFSAAGCIGIKIRSRLGDATLDALLFLRSFFQNQRTK